nr:hypothetical protein CFP56_35230 [Quercus suber]
MMKKSLSSSSSDTPKTHPDPNNQPDQTATQAPHLLPNLHLQPGIPLPHDPLPPRALPSHAGGDPHRPEVVGRCLERQQRGHRIPHRVEANPRQARRPRQNPLLSSPTKSILMLRPRHSHRPDLG